MNLTAGQLNYENVYAMQEEIDWMREAGKGLPPDATVVMIGAGPGVLLVSLLECGREDLWPEVVDIVTTTWCKKSVERATAEQPSLIPRLYCERTRWIEGQDSNDVGHEYSGKPIDLLIVDGDHRERGIRRDLEAWLKHVAPGGLVFFHDYSFDNTPWADRRVRPARTADDFPEVKEQVDAEMAIRNWQQAWRGGCAAVYRRPHGSP